MTTPPKKPTKAERREEQRAAREAAMQAEQFAEQRKKRLLGLGGVLAVAAAIVLVLVLVSGGGDDKGAAGAGAGSDVTGVADVQAMFEGIPQSGITLGKPDAPVTIVEFADMQCPVCKTYSETQLPRVVQDHVATGNANLEFRMLSFLGEDSVRMGRVVTAAGFQNKLFETQELFFRNQGEENTGYATDEYIRSILDAVPGLDVERTLKDAESEKAKEEMAAANTLMSRRGVQGTPTVFVGTSEDDLQMVENPLEDGAVAQAVEAALAKKR
jgi:protein-disulfide isomerase